VALTKDKKHEVVAQIGEPLDSSRYVVVVYKGTPVKALRPCAAIAVKAVIHH